MIASKGCKVLKNKPAMESEVVYATLPNQTPYPQKPRNSPGARIQRAVLRPTDDGDGCKTVPREAPEAGPHGCAPITLPTSIVQVLLLPRHPQTSLIVWGRSCGKRWNLDTLVLRG